MNIGYIIALVLFVILGILLICLLTTKDSKISPIDFYAIYTICGCGILMGVFLGLGIHISEIKSTPQAIDVYRHNTSIEVVYTVENNDTVNCDTTIIFK